jgi:hypothetical protein
MLDTSVKYMDPLMSDLNRWPFTRHLKHPCLQTGDYGLSEKRTGIKQEVSMPPPMPISITLLCDLIH